LSSDEAAAEAGRLLEVPEDHDVALARLGELVRTTTPRQQVQCNALMVVDRLGPADVVEDLLWDRLRHDSNSDVFRVAAACLLRRHPGDRRVLNTVADRVEQASHSQLRGVGARILVEHDPAHPQRAMLVTLAAVLDTVSLWSDDEQVAVVVEKILGAQGDHDIVLARLSELARASRSFYQVRCSALVVLDRLGPADAVEDLLWDRLLHDVDDDVFRVAATCLLRRHPGDQRVLDAVASRVERMPDTALARVAVELLNKHNPAHPRLRSIVTLIRVLNPDFWSPDEEKVAAAVAQVLDAHDDHNIVLTQLSELATATAAFSQVRCNALIALDRLGPADVVEKLLWDQLLHDGNSDVFRVAAACLLRRHPGDQRVLGAVASRVEQMPGTSLAREGVDLLNENNQDHPSLAVNGARLHFETRVAVARDRPSIGDLPELTGYGPYEPSVRSSES
jgi:hypothetical protein